jgi:hypothetical protein
MQYSITFLNACMVVLLMLHPVIHLYNSGDIFPAAHMCRSQNDKYVLASVPEPPYPFRPPPALSGNGVPEGLHRCSHTMGNKLQIDASVNLVRMREMRGWLLVEMVALATHFYMARVDLELKP